MRTRITIEPDNDTESPREWDNLGKIIHWHRRYNFGKEIDRDDAQRYLASECLTWCRVEERLEAARDAFPYRYGWQDRIDRIEDKMREAVIDAELVVLPLYLYDHSGLRLSTGPFGCPWDSGQVGYIYCSLEDARKEWSVPAGEGWSWVAPSGKTLLEAVMDCLQGEVSAYDRYLSGDVWHWEVETSESDDEDVDDWDTYDSCGGCYGYAYAESEAAEAVARAERDAAGGVALCNLTLTLDTRKDIAKLNSNPK